MPYSLTIRVCWPCRERESQSRCAPPYYGLRVVPGITFTMGGVLVNRRCEALNP